MSVGFISTSLYILHIHNEFLYFLLQCDTKQLTTLTQKTRCFPKKDSIIDQLLFIAVSIFKCKIN